MNANVPIQPSRALTPSTLRGRVAFRLAAFSVLVALALACAQPASAAVGDFKGKWGSLGSGNGQLNYDCGVAVAPNQDVYVVDSFNNRVQYFSPNGAFKGGWGVLGAGAGDFAKPQGIDIAPNGDVYVTEYDNNRVQYFGVPPGCTRAAGAWAAARTGNSLTRVGISVASNGDVYVV